MINAYDITYLQATGNHENQYDDDNLKIIYNLGLCYNSIAVGAIDDMESFSTSDDVLCAGSAYRNCIEYNDEMIYGCLKPDVVAPSNGWGCGTSTATPVVTSIVALMLELKPSLATHPQIIKSILMASCHRKANDPVTGELEEVMTDGLTLKQGAGVVNGYKALCIVGNSQYGERTIESYSERDTITIVQPKYSNSYLNVSIAWFNQNNIILDSIYPSPLTARGYIPNLDLYVNKITSNPVEANVAYSENTNSSTELAYFSIASNERIYKVNVEKYEPDNYSTTFGYAWSTDNMEYKNLDCEGLYLIKNKRSRLYLEVDNLGYLYQVDNSLGVSNIWVLKENSSGNFSIYNGGNSGVIGKGALSSDGSYDAITLDNENIVLTLEENPNGSYLIKSQFNESIIEKYLYIRNGSYLAGEEACWWDTTIGDSGEWYLERVNYEKGDLDTNGIINSDDGYIIVEHFMYGEPITEIEKYLGDMNEDGVVNNADFNLLMEMVE